MNRRFFRSTLGRAIGLGSAKSGSQHWLVQRVTAVALAPLTLWFVASIIAHAGSDYPVFIAWLRTPFVAGGMILLLIALFHHTALGLQVVIEDYVHSGRQVCGGDRDSALLLRSRRHWNCRHPAHRIWR
jgi:succinate dehydrogenase / fumarate reductase, membrane anchor subunit